MRKSLRQNTAALKRPEGVYGRIGLKEFAQNIPYNPSKNPNYSENKSSLEKMKYHFKHTLCYKLIEKLGTSYTSANEHTDLNTWQNQENSVYSDLMKKGYAEMKHTKSPSEVKAMNRRLIHICKALFKPLVDISGVKFRTTTTTTTSTSTSTGTATDDCVGLGTHFPGGAMRRLVFCNPEQAFNIFIYDGWNQYFVQADELPDKDIEFLAEVLRYKRQLSGSWPRGWELTRSGSLLNSEQCFHFDSRCPCVAFTWLLTPDEENVGRSGTHVVVYDEKDWTKMKKNDAKEWLKEVFGRVDRTYVNEALQDKNNRANWKETATYISLNPETLGVFLTTHLHRGPGCSIHYVYSMFFDYNCVGYPGGYTDGDPVTCLNWEEQFFTDDIQDQTKLALFPIQWSNDGKNCVFPEIFMADELKKITKSWCLRAP